MYVWKNIPYSQHWSARNSAGGATHCRFVRTYVVHIVCNTPVALQKWLWVLLMNILTWTCIHNKDYEYYVNMHNAPAIVTTGGCHSHRLYSHSCDHGSRLWPALFSSLTVDHANFWPLTFDRSDILPAKKSRYLNCNPSPRACMLGNKRSVHV